LDLEAIEAPHSTAVETDHSWSRQQAEFPTPPASTPRPRHKARGKPATSGSPHLASPAAPAKPSPPEPADLNANLNASDAQQLQKPPRKKAPRKKKNKVKDDSMTGLRKEAYVPPHLRNRNSANGTKADSAQSGTAANGSPATSAKSKTTLQTKLHSFP
jgi:hypothetical protein